MAAGASLLLALSMVIDESVVARTFGTCTLRAFGGDADSILVPVLGVGPIVFACLVNASGTGSVGLVSIVMAVLKVGGIALFNISALWASGLPLDRIVASRDDALAEAARPALGQSGFYLTVALALVATASGPIASVFADSRIRAMLTDMKMIPHSHFGMPGTIKDHTLVYTVVIAGFLTVDFDFGRIASLGAFFHLVMDMILHLGVFQHLRGEIGAQAGCCYRPSCSMPWCWPPSPQ